MDAKMEVARTVSMLRSLLRTELESCECAIKDGQLDRVAKEITGVHDKLSRAINVLNRLR